MTTLRLCLPALFAALLIPGPPAAAQSLADCRAIEDRLERFDCYEALEAEASGQEAAATPAREPAPRDDAVEDRAEPSAAAGEHPDATRLPSAAGEQRAPPQAAGSASDFGRRPDASASRVVEEGGRTELHGTVADLVERLPNTWLITLEGGEQWLQMNSRPYRLRVGEPVRIYPTQWGSAYRLTSERLSGYIQVERVD